MSNATPAAVRPSLFRRLWRWIVRLLATVGFFFLVYHFCFDLEQVVSPSMAPTLQGNSPADGDWLLSDKWTYRFRRPHRYELVYFRNRDGLMVAKRVVGLPGERIAIKDLWITINDKPVERPASLSFLKYYPYGSLRTGSCYDCAHEYFLLGDNSRDSYDSRFEGALPENKILARPWLIVWPPSRFGWVNP